jgi:eukaryotic-like serine/threonine-protein kinase
VSKSEQIKRFYDFGPYRVDAGERVLLREGKPVMLTPKLFDTLLALVERSGHIVEKSELMEMVWPGTFVEESNLSSSVSLLRKTLGSAADGSSYIETVPRRGYRFASAVELTDESMGVLVGRRTRVHVVTREEEETADKEEISEIKTLPATMGIETVPSSQARLAANKPDRRLIVFGILAILAVIASVLVMIRFLGSQNPASKTAAFARIKLTRLTTTGRVHDAAISPDAKFLAHVVETSGQHGLWLRNIATGSNQEIVPASPGKLSGLTFSPDGNHIYFIRTPGGGPGPNVLFQVPVLGGQPRKLVTDIDTSITFSPDGKRLVFARGIPSRGQRLLVLAKADGTEEQVLATHKLEDRSLVGPAWSPNGETIVFALGGSSNDAQYLNLMEVHLKDRVEKQITFHQWSSMASICWMNDGNGLVLSAAEEPGSNSQIWYVSYPAGAVRSITNDLNDYAGLGLAADSLSLVAVQTEKISDIWIAPNGDALHAERITSSRSDGGGGISWTPDGRIVHASVAGGNQEIWIMNKDGSGRQQLTFAGNWESRPSVSNDGRYIVFASRQSGSTNIWRMDIDGTNRKQLTRSNTDWNPQVTSDSRWVIYASAQSGQISIWKVWIEGGDPIQITNYYSPLIAVSPKDGQIAYGYDEQESLKRRVAIMSTEGGASTRVFDFPHPLRQGIRFAPDGRALTFVGVPSRSSIWSQPLDGTAPKKIADFAPDRIFSFDWSRDGKYLAVAHGTNISDVVLIKNQP